MATQDASKTKTFALWKSGMTLKAIQGQVSAKPETVRAWVLDWERGRQGTWTATVK